MKPLKRHPDLIERSREHHHALALCVRILRDADKDHRCDIEEHLADLWEHFSEEEAQFAPYWGRLAPALRQRFEAEHVLLREMAAAPQHGNAEWNIRFATALRDHVRFEERELFPAVEPFLD